MIAALKQVEACRAVDNMAREREVLALFVADKSIREIATESGISRATVKFQISMIFSSTGVDDRTRAAVAALQRGLVRL